MSLKRMTKIQMREQEIAERRAFLLDDMKIKPGANVYIVNVHTNGNQYQVLVPCVEKDGRLTIVDITYHVATLCGHRRTPHGAIVMPGCGYNKAHQIVYDMGLMLWPKGTPEPHGKRNGKEDSYGGFALRYHSLGGR